MPGKADRLRSLKNDLFERNYWWMAPLVTEESQRQVKWKLDAQHSELTNGVDRKKRPILRHPPIVWEVMRHHPEIPKIRAAVEIVLQDVQKDIPEALCLAMQREKFSLQPLQDL